MCGRAGICLADSDGFFVGTLARVGAGGKLGLVMGFDWKRFEAERVGTARSSSAMGRFVRRVSFTVKAAPGRRTPKGARRRDAAVANFGGKALESIRLRLASKLHLGPGSGGEHVDVLLGDESCLNNAAGDRQE